MYIYIYIHKYTLIYSLLLALLGICSNAQVLRCPARQWSSSSRQLRCRGQWCRPRRRMRQQQPDLAGKLPRNLWFLFKLISYLTGTSDFFQIDFLFDQEKQWNTCAEEPFLVQVSKTLATGEGRLDHGFARWIWCLCDRSAPWNNLFCLHCWDICCFLSSMKLGQLRYRLFGIPYDATDGMIKSSYRKLSLLHSCSLCFSPHIFG